MRKAGSSTGAVIEIVASNVPVGLGEPVYDKLDADLAKAMMSINAVKGVEIGAGFAAAALSGEENADEMRMRDGKVAFLSNHAGGILGGISTGQDIVARFAVKPTSSILTPRRTVDIHGNEIEVSDQGPPRPVRRHPRRAGGRGDDGGGARRPSAAPPRAVRLSRHGARQEHRPCVASFSASLRSSAVLSSLSFCLGAGLWIWLRVTEYRVADNTVLTLDLTAAFPDAPPSGRLQSLVLPERRPLRDVLDGLERAGGDPRVKGLVARIGDGSFGLAQMQELRDAVAAFRAQRQVRHRVLRQLRRVRLGHAQLLSRDRRSTRSGCSRWACSD